MEHNPSTERLLGELVGTVKAIQKMLTSQNGAIASLWKKLDDLPCNIQIEKINKLTAWYKRMTEDKAYISRIGYRLRRELVIALSAAVAGTVLGVWIHTMLT